MYIDSAIYTAAAIVEHNTRTKQQKHRQFSPLIKLIGRAQMFKFAAELIIKPE